MFTFSRVYKPYTFVGGGVCENQHLFHTLITFCPDFYYFHGDVWHSKDVDVYSFVGGGGIIKCMVCVLMKMLTFVDGPLHKSYKNLFIMTKALSEKKLPNVKYKWAYEEIHLIICHLKITRCTSSKPRVNYVY